MVDRRRQVGAGEQPALLPHLDRHRARTDAVQDLPRQRIRHHAERRGVQHQGCGVGRREAVVQPVRPEIRDRRHVDHQLARSSRAGWSAAKAFRTSRADAGPCTAGLEQSAGRRSLTRIAALICFGARRTKPPRPMPGWYVIPRMRLGHPAVKLPIANVRWCPMAPARAAVLPVENPAKTDIFAPIATFQRTRAAANPDIDENRSLPYKPRNCPRWPGSTGGGSFGP